MATFCEGTNTRCSFPTEFIALPSRRCFGYDLANRTLRICIKENDEPFNFKS